MSKLLGSWDPKMLGVLECLEVVPPLGSAEFETKVDQHLLEGTLISWLAGSLPLLQLQTHSPIDKDLHGNVPSRS